MNELICIGSILANARMMYLLRSATAEPNNQLYGRAHMYYDFGVCCKMISAILKVMREPIGVLFIIRSASW